MHVILVVSVVVFGVAELVAALRRRRDRTRADVWAEVSFRLLFFGAILLLPLGRALVHGAAIGGGWPVLALGAADPVRLVAAAPHRTYGINARRSGG